MSYSSIFNEVLGPIMVGPSSSHTAGPARIGKMCWQALPDEPQSIRITFDRLGSFAATYVAQGSNYGFIGGLLGVDIGDESIRQALKMAEDKGIDYKFQIESLPGAHHPNFALIEVKTKSGFELKVQAASTGGGMFEISSFQGRALSLKGDCHELIFLAPGSEKKVEAAEAVLNASGFGFKTHQGPDLLNIKLDKLNEPLKAALAEAMGEVPVYLAPVLPVVKLINARPPFRSAAEALLWAEKEAADSPQALALAYESALSGRQPGEIEQMMLSVARVMKAAALKGLAGNFKPRGFLPPQTVEMKRNIDSGRVRQLDLGVLNKAALWACAVMDYDICLGVVAAAPTGGSAGVLPACLIAVGEELGADERAIAHALLTAALVGVFIDHQATFAAEMAACQAEIGAASAMAAAGLVQLLGGTPSQAFAAASLALQNMLGLVCDPVGGVGNVPCINRNASGAANALVSANMVLAGFNPALPLDEVIEAMKSVGQMLPPELRCTGRGGLCLTPTAHKLCAGLHLEPRLD